MWVLYLPMLWPTTSQLKHRECACKCKSASASVPLFLHSSWKVESGPQHFVHRHCLPCVGGFLETCFWALEKPCHQSKFIQLLLILSQLSADRLTVRVLGGRRPNRGTERWFWGSAYCFCVPLLPATCAAWSVTDSAPSSTSKAQFIGCLSDGNYFGVGKCPRCLTIKL